MDFRLLKPGHRVKLKNGQEAVVLDADFATGRVQLRYLPSGTISSLEGTVDVVPGEEVSALLGVAEVHQWEFDVSAALYRESGNPGEPDRYLASTMGGVPFGAVVTCESLDREGALSKLVGALTAFGYSGDVHVRDVSLPGGSKKRTLRV